MARMDCPFESEVLELATSGAWPARASESLRAHAETCGVCRDLALVSVAIADAHSDTHARPALPSAGTVWFRAQIRARQDAVKEVARPITIAQAIGFAACVGVVGAVFGATTGWFQRMLTRAGAYAAERVTGWNLPELTTQTTTLLIVVGIGLVLTTAIVVWAFREDS
jgi:hypothetical protein